MVTTTAKKSTIAPKAPPPLGRRERKKQELRTRIYETARQLFLEHGFESTTVDQIADAADIAQATFFNHFSNKHAVLSEMTNEVSAHLQDMVDQQRNPEVSAQEQIAGFAARVAGELVPARNLARNVILEVMHASIHGEDLPYLSRIQDPFEEIIIEGQKRGEVRKDLDAGFITEMVLGLLNVPVTNWLNDMDYPLEERLRIAAEFVGEAIRPRE